MKITRHKKVHRILQFYSNNFGFRKPYQVLIDGTLCYAALKNKVHIENQFKKYLEGDVKLLTTECNVVEVDKLGPQFSGASFIIKQYPIHRCGHSKAPVSGSKCILDMVSDSNARYIVATQDKELQARCRELSGVPILYLHMKTPTLEAPSDFTKQTASEQMNNHYKITEYEKRRLDLLDDRPQNPIEIRRKRKRKGGPNPLSCKKKKKKPGNEERGPGSGKKKNKPRKRVRNRLVQKIKKELMSSG